MSRAPRILFFDIETFPIEAYVWALFDQNVGLNQIKQDWTMASFCAKWAGSKEVTYLDVSSKRNCRDDKALVKALWKMLDDADIVVGQNSKRFDTKKANARFAYYKLGKPSPYQQIDTLQLAKKHFAFTSNKLEYTSGHLVPSSKKDCHKEYPGFELWRACMLGDKRAWSAMKRYNIRDVIALEGLFNELAPWGTGVDMRVFSPRPIFACPVCTSESIQSRGYFYTNSGKFRKLQCTACSHWFSEKGAKNNKLSKEKRASLKGAGK
jgi:uncharacterized protein YprB with RNaseH-like and TPR domain